MMNKELTYEDVDTGWNGCATTDEIAGDGWAGKGVNLSEDNTQHLPVGGIRNKVFTRKRGVVMEAGVEYPVVHTRQVEAAILVDAHTGTSRVVAVEDVPGVVRVAGRYDGPMVRDELGGVVVGGVTISPNPGGAITPKTKASKNKTFAIPGNGLRDLQMIRQMKMSQILNTPGAADDVHRKELEVEVGEFVNKEKGIVAVSGVVVDNYIPF